MMMMLSSSCSSSSNCCYRASRVSFYLVNIEMVVMVVIAVGSGNSWEAESVG